MHVGVNTRCMSMELGIAHLRGFKPVTRSSGSQRSLVSVRNLLSDPCFSSLSAKIDLNKASRGLHPTTDATGKNSQTPPSDKISEVFEMAQNPPVFP